MADVFLKGDVRMIFKGKKVLFLGDSVLRNLYQDFVYILEKGSLTPNALLKKKGTQIESGMFPGDSLVPGTGNLESGRHYKEVCFYCSNPLSLNSVASTYCVMDKIGLKVVVFFRDVFSFDIVCGIMY